MGNAESKSANRLGGSGKLRQSKKATKEKRSCSEQLELHTEQLHKTHRCCCERQQKARKSVSSKFIRMPRRLAPKTSEGTVASGCCCTRLALRVPRMAEDTVAMSRTTVTSAAVEERVAMAAVATAVRWHDLNRASLATAGAVLSAAVCGTAKPKRREGNDRNGVHPRKGGGSTKSDRTAPSVGRSSVVFDCAVDRPDAVTVILADYSLGDNVSLDEINLAASGTGTAAIGGRLGVGIRRQRPAGRSFDGRRAKSFRHQQIRSAPPAGIGLHQPSIVAGGLRPRPQTMANGAIEQQLGVPCPITGLTLAQKRLILVRWRQLSDADMLRLSENIFERTFRRNESFARTILRQNDKNWKRTQFRVLTMRFSNVLSALCASLEDYPSSGAELLAEFGAQHALGLDNGQIIPPSFWDVLLLSICEAAGASEGQQMECFAPAGCALSAGSSLSASSSGVSSSPSAPAAPMLLPQWTRRSADAWAQFAVFVSAQMRFGYEMERFLRERMRKRMQEKGIARRRRSLSANGSLTTTTNLSLPETIEWRRGERSAPEGEQLK